MLTVLTVRGELREAERAHAAASERSAVRAAQPGQPAASRGEEERP
ncbi:hypothetical protein [Streptomyces sp. NPDC102487]